MKKKAMLCGAAVVGLAASGAHATPVLYTDSHSDQVASSNKLRDIWSATVDNDANNLIFTIVFDPAADVSAGGNFNYGIGITNGSPSAGGDTSGSASTGNAYHRAISIDSSLGGMMDWVGIFGAPSSANGSAAKPFTSYGFNDFVFGTPGSSKPAGVWTNIETVSSGEPVAPQSPGTTNSTITVTVPMADFASNLPMSTGTTFEFDIYSTGTSAGQTAYDSLADSSPTNATNSPTTQYNGTVLESYTIQAVPEPTLAGIVGLGCLALLKRRPKT